MKNVKNFYYICEDEHLTVGDTDRKTKCEMTIKDIKLTKKGKEITRELKCGKTLEEAIKIPDELDLFDIWDPKMLKAFMIGQIAENLREGFLGDLQKVFTGLKTKIDDLERELGEVKGNKDGNK